MNRYFILAALGLASMGSTGCLFNAYSSNPTMRMRALLNQSEDLRQVEQEWSRFWFTDHPSHLTPERIDGGIQ